MSSNPSSIKGPYLIVVGNEKGGVGKTTTAIHVALSLLYDGYKVATIDIDSRQRSISHYLENRRNHIIANKNHLPFPSHFIINLSKLDSQEDKEADEENRFLECLEKASAKSDFIVIDAPGNDTFMSRLAHSFANTIITPINDSFVDLSVLARINDETLKIDRHGVYSEMIWEAKINHAKHHHGDIDWVIVRNRLTNIDANNKRRVAEALNNLSRRVGCRVAHGLSERVIYRELYLAGLSLLDVVNEKNGVKPKMSHLAARQELRELMNFLNLENRIVFHQKPSTANKNVAFA